MSERVALVTNVDEYAGPGAVVALSDAGFAVACHDRAFADASRREGFAGAHRGAFVARAQEPDALARELDVHGRIDVLVNNDFHFPAAEWETNAALRERVERDVPLGWFGRQEEMGALIAFVASRNAAPVTGQFIRRRPASMTASGRLPR